eukprot:14518253-Alexandrium_andersonii.AAC.1
MSIDSHAAGRQPGCLERSPALPPERERAAELPATWTEHTLVEPWVHKEARHMVLLGTIHRGHAIDYAQKVAAAKKQQDASAVPSVA